MKVICTKQYWGEKWMGKWSSAVVKAELKIRKKSEKIDSDECCIKERQQHRKWKKARAKVKKKTACGDSEEAEV